MKKTAQIIMIILTSSMIQMIYGQDNISQLLNAGLNDATLFTKSYIKPASEGLIYSMSNSWYTTVQAKKLGQFEISIQGNLSFVKNEDQKFMLNTNDYENIIFKNGPAQQKVATVFGENDPDIYMMISYTAPDGTVIEEEIELPQGLGSSGVNFIPNAGLQGSVGLIKGTEIKARFLPKLKIEDASLSSYGFALQHEITSWIPGGSVLPFHFSLLAGFSQIDSKYGLNEKSNIEGQNQKLALKSSSFLFTGIISTRLPILNFYGGLGYVTGKTHVDLKGTYLIQPTAGGSISYEDPISISQSASGIKGTLGMRLKLGFFRLNADYNFQKYNSVAAGLSFGI